MDIRNGYKKDKIRLVNYLIYWWWKIMYFDARSVIGVRILPKREIYSHAGVSIISVLCLEDSTYILTMWVQQRSYPFLARQRFQDNIAERCIMISRISYAWIERSEIRDTCPEEIEIRRRITRVNGQWKTTVFGKQRTGSIHERDRSILRLTKHLNIPRNQK